MNQTEHTNNREGPVGQAVIVWPKGIREEAIVYPLGATDEETEAIRRLLKRVIGRERG